MGGGVSMPAVPVSASTEAALKKLYDEKKAATIARRRAALLILATGHRMWLTATAFGSRWGRTASRTYLEVLQNTWGKPRTPGRPGN